MLSRTAVPQLTVELELWQCGLRVVAGVDEVGMGPLAGPVVAAAVVLPPVCTLEEALRIFPPGIRDSKTLTAKARERLDRDIRHIAVGIGIALVDVDEIDQSNIYQAGLNAMRGAIAHLPVPPEHVLIDGRALPNLPYPHSSFIKGDREVFSIAAASIVAKVYRDRLMQELDKRYPEYGFARHMGYGTAAHREALRRFGPSPIHRRSFRLL